MQAWQRRGVWEAVAAEVGGHRQRGLSPVLTKDTVRFAICRALVDAGLQPTARGMAPSGPSLARIDLTVEDPLPARAGVSHQMTGRSIRYESAPRASG